MTNRIPNRIHISRKMKGHEIQCKVCWDNGKLKVVIKESNIIGHYEKEQMWFDKKKRNRQRRKRKNEKKRFQHDINGIQISDTVYVYLASTSIIRKRYTNK